MITSASIGDYLAALAILLLILAAAAATLLFVRYRGKSSFRPHAVRSGPPYTRATTRLVLTREPRASTSNPALEFASHEYLASHVSQPGVAGELWVREYVNRLRSALPGIHLEGVRRSLVWRGLHIEREQVGHRDRSIVAGRDGAVDERGGLR
jgi:hypothetical protein